MGFPNIFGMSLPKIGYFYWFLNKRSKKCRKSSDFFPGFLVLILKIGQESQFLGLGFSGFRIPENFGIQIFGIQDSWTSGFSGIQVFWDPEPHPTALYSILSRDKHKHSIIPQGPGLKKIFRWYNFLRNLNFLSCLKIYFKMDLAE